MVIFKVRYADYENKTTDAIADTIDCSVHKKPVNHDVDVDVDQDYADDPNHDTVMTAIQPVSEGLRANDK